MVKPRIVRAGVDYHTVGSAAKLLRTNVVKVKEMMGNGTLEWLNLKTDGHLYITESSILAYLHTEAGEQRIARARERKKRDLSTF